MIVSEIFYSIQGEGRLAGQPSAFIRLAGCNLRCAWCDTPYASRDARGDRLTAAEVLDRISGYPTRFVVLTGGEPMLQEELTELTRALRAGGYHITIETAGTVWRPVECDLASISPKLSNSTPGRNTQARLAAEHERRRINLPVLRRLVREFAHELKFVIQQPEDVNEAAELVRQIGCVRPEDVVLMPEGTTVQVLTERSAWLSELCKRYGFRFGPRLHIYLYGNRPGT